MKEDRGSKENSGGEKIKRDKKRRKCEPKTLVGEEKRKQFQENLLPKSRVEKG